MNQDQQEKNTVPEVLREISQSFTVSVEQCPFVECLALTDVVSDRSEVVPCLQMTGESHREMVQS